MFATVVHTYMTLCTHVNFVERSIMVDMSTSLRALIDGWMTVPNSKGQITQISMKVLQFCTTVWKVHDCIETQFYSYTRIVKSSWHFKHTIMTGINILS